MNDPISSVLEDAMRVIHGLREYIAAIPSDTVAAFPAMPGIDGDWVDATLVNLQATKEHRSLQGIPGVSDGAPAALVPGAYWYVRTGHPDQICEKREGEDFVRFTNGSRQDWIRTGESFVGPLQTPSLPAKV